MGKGYKEPSIKYVHPKTAIFEPTTHPCTVPLTPSLYRRTLVTQDTMDVKKNQEYEAN